MAFDSPNDLSITKSWVTLITTYQTNRKVMSGHVHNMAYNKLTMILRLGTFVHYLYFVICVRTLSKTQRLDPSQLEYLRARDYKPKIIPKHFDACFLGRLWIISTPRIYLVSPMSFVSKTWNGYLLVALIISKLFLVNGMSSTWGTQSPCWSFDIHNGLLKP